MKLAVIFTAVIVLCGNLIPACCFPQTNFWKQTNGPLGGYVYNMAQMPTGEIIVSTMTGLFLSADGGYTWETIYFGENRFHSLAISGNMLFGADLQNGAFRSTDMGRSWAHVGTYYNSNVFSTRSGLVFVSDLFNRILTRSTDQGISWETVKQGMAIIDLAEDTSGTLYACGDGFHIYVSRNRGAAWESKVTGFPDKDAHAIEADDMGNIYIVITGIGIYRSSDKGETWTQAVDGLGDLTSLNFMVADQNGSVYASSSNGSIFISTNHGMMWNVQAKLGVKINQMRLADNGAVLVGTDGRGLFRKHADSNEYDKIGLPASFVNGLINRPDGKILADADYSIYETTDYGNHWKVNGSRITWDAPIGRPMLATSKNTCFGCYFLIKAYGSYFIIYRSVQDGPWTSVLRVDDANLGLDALASNSRGHIFVGTNGGIYRSTDNGDTWAKFNQGLPSAAPSEILADSSDNVLAGISFNGIYKSTDNGETWSFASNGIDRLSDYMRSFAIGMSGIVYAVFESTQYMGPTTIYATSDFGGHWVRQPWNVPPISRLFFGNGGSVYGFKFNDKYTLRSIDGGNNWQRLDTGLHDRYITCMTASNDGHLLIGTYGGGVYCSAVPVLMDVRNTPIPVPSDVILEQSYPNPFNSTAIIRFSIPSTGHVCLKVFNVQGREIIRLIDEHRSEGPHDIIFDSSDIPGGIYFYRLNFGSSYETRKLVIVK